MDTEHTHFADLAALSALCRDLPAGDAKAAEAAAARQHSLTKPPGSLGRLEDLAIWLARWQGRERPKLDHVDVLVFAGAHGVSAQGVSAFPPEVTGQMVANFEAGGAAINQLADTVGAALEVVPLAIATPTGDITQGPAMDETAFLAAAAAGYGAVRRESDLVCLGEMGIANTTAAAALCFGLYGGAGADWVGRGTGVDAAGLKRKAEAIERAVAVNGAQRDAPLALMAALGGRELAAMFGACLAARRHGVPVVLDGFVSTAAVAALAGLCPGGLDHALAAHLSAEQGHRALLAKLDLAPVLDLGMRLGEGSGAALAVAILRAALACHNGMATFAEAGVSE